MKVLKEEQWQEEVTSKLRSFEKSLIIALKEKGWDGKESEETVTWTFAGGLFYSITVITTIGYIFFKLCTLLSKIRPKFCQPAIMSTLLKPCVEALDNSRL